MNHLKNADDPKKIITTNNMNNNEFTDGPFTTNSTLPHNSNYLNKLFSKSRRYNASDNTYDKSTTNNLPTEERRILKIPKKGGKKRKTKKNKKHKKRKTKKHNIKRT